MKRYIVDGNVIDTRNVVGFAGERLFVEFDDHAALLRAVAEEVKQLPHSDLCDALASGWAAGLEVAPGDLDCNCPKSRALALLEVKNGN